MLEIKHLHASYGTNKILHDINLSVAPGEIVCLLGVNGCGKTTLLRAIADLIAFEGEIYLDSKPLHGQNRRAIAKQVALLSQMHPGMFSYTVEQMVTLGRYARQKQGLFVTESKQDRDFVRDCLQKTQIYDLKDRPLRALSGGQLQRVYLACVFAQDPQMILLDEPTNHLDFPFQLALTDFVKEWAKQKNRAVVAVLHDINLAFHLADRIVLLDKGRIAMDAPVSSFPLSAIDEVYQTDLSGFMRASLGVWAQDGEKQPL